jgi:hypothetical protein
MAMPSSNPLLPVLTVASLLSVAQHDDAQQRYKEEPGLRTQFTAFGGLMIGAGTRSTARTCKQTPNA